MSSSCCHKNKKDKFLIALLVLGTLFYFMHLLIPIFNFNLPGSVIHLFHKFFEIINTMSLGIGLGIVFVGIMGYVPREYIISILGKPGSKGSLIRATIAGLFLDLCSHGILMVGMKLYERGASTGQVMAFLIASPWNSLSLTLILFSLIGLKWTLLFIFLSVVIGLISGLVFNYLESKNVIPVNPNSIEIDENFRLIDALKRDLKTVEFSLKGFFALLKNGLKDSKMIIKWLMFGALLSSVISTYVSQEIFQNYFGPSLLGLLATLGVTTVLEVCSEGATPLAADLLNRGAAPGNAFTFLMAGVATDYTEIMSIKDTMKSWKIALFLPLITVPQILVLGYLINKLQGI